MDILMIALCLSIGSCVPWLIAIYGEGGDRQLIENHVLGLAGTGLGALAFNWMSPTYSLVALVFLGPAVAFLAILAGQTLKRAVLSRLSRPLR